MYTDSQTSIKQATTPAEYYISRIITPCIRSLETVGHLHWLTLSSRRFKHMAIVKFICLQSLSIGYSNFYHIFGWRWFLHIFVVEYFPSWKLLCKTKRALKSWNMYWELWDLKPELKIKRRFTQEFPRRKIFNYEDIIFYVILKHS